jgi:hypothetical protein
MLNAMPEEIMARLLFKHNSGATHVLFKTQTENDGLNLLVTAVAKLSENATTLNLPQAFGYNERTLPKYKLAYEARMKNKLMKGKQTSEQTDLFKVTGAKRLAPGPETRVQKAANTAAEGRQNESDQRERMANSTKRRTPKMVVPKPGTTNSTKRGTPRTVVPKPGTTSATTKCRSRSVVTRQDKRGSAAKGRQLVVTR